ncbi:hypothetical protein [Natrononativus amylolyticus]|uniref:hypothetical protein n=1 Tax=Natrononativus amylolyticus TaxID=2963434 RepID=UPI0020CBBBF1|nr:hypothetical protein [Natrononativus amylolyticus]
MRYDQRLAALLAAVMILSVVALPGMVAAEEGENDHLDVDVEQDELVYVTVTANDTAVENATLNVSVADENASYADAGDYDNATDENGTASFSAPNETVNVTVTATADGAFGTAEATFEPAPENGGEPKFSNFGERVSWFVSDNFGSTDGPFGLSVASFVLENNPGNAPEHAGPSGDQGPPDHAGPSDDNGDEEDDDEEDDDRQGPPSHAGPPDDDDSDDTDDS